MIMQHIYSLVSDPNATLYNSIQLDLYSAFNNGTGLQSSFTEVCNFLLVAY